MSLYAYSVAKQMVFPGRGRLTCVGGEAGPLALEKLPSLGLAWCQWGRRGLTSWGVLKSRLAWSKQSSFTFSEFTSFELRQRSPENLMQRKRRSLNQIKEDHSFRILRKKLPESWVIHEYGPDYGIDCVVELFDYIDAEKNIAETLGEVFYVQLKSSSAIDYCSHRVFARGNVEKGVLAERKNEFFDISVVKFQLETSELLTVQAMGSAIPVLLIVVDVVSERAFYVCLNDYIDKILLPEDPNFSTKDSKTLYLPTQNELRDSETCLVGPRAYGKRAKMCGAFAKFYFQKKEIERSQGLAKFNPPMSDEHRMDMLSTFVNAALRQDIWATHEFWAPIKDSHLELQGIRAALDQGIEPSEIDSFVAYCDDVVWSKLCNLSSMYEELVREWFLPSYFSQLTSYPTVPSVG